nr:ADP-ribosylglycohydrolase family protein [Halarchaeum acidiphilum]
MGLAGARGLLLGLACGDALGRPVEFESAASISSEYGTLTEMVGHGTWNQPTGTITDDTEQALCIARSLAERGGFDPADVADRFVAWYDSGPFDIGRMTMRSLSRLEHGDAWDEAGQQVWEAVSKARTRVTGA